MKENLTILQTPDDINYHISQSASSLLSVKKMGEGREKSSILTKEKSENLMINQNKRKPEKREIVVYWAEINGGLGQNQQK